MAIEHIAPLVWAPLLAGMEKSCQLMAPRPALNNMQTGQLRKEEGVLKAGLEFMESLLVAINTGFELMYKACPEETDTCISTVMTVCSSYVILVRKADLERNDWFKPKLSNIKHLVTSLTKKVNKARGKQ